MTTPDTDTLAGLRYHKLVRGDPGYRDQMCIRADGQWLNRRDAEALQARVIALEAQAAKDKARIERLEAALRFYSGAYEPALSYPSEGPWGVNSDDFGAVARAALEDGE